MTASVRTRWGPTSVNVTRVSCSTQTGAPVMVSSAFPLMSLDCSLIALMFRSSKSVTLWPEDDV